MINSIFENLFKPVSDEEHQDRLQETFEFMVEFEKNILSGMSNGDAVNATCGGRDGWEWFTMDWPYITRVVGDLLRGRSSRAGIYNDYSNFKDEMLLVKQFRQWKERNDQ